MSEPIDDKALDEYLSGRSRISQRYRALADDAGETVPPELDRRILAQARNAVAPAAVEQVSELAQLRAKRRRLMQWGVPSALAASAVLVISIVIQSGRQHEVQAVHERSVTVPAAAVPPAPPAPPPPVAARQQSTDANTQDSVVLIAPPQNAVTEFSPLAPPAAAAAKEASRAERSAMRLPAPAAPQEASKAERNPAAAAMASAGQQPVAAPAPADDQRTRHESTAARAHAEYERDDLPEVAATAAARESSAASAASVLDVPVLGAIASPPSGEQSESADLHGDPQRWLEHIRELRKNGRNAEADSDWQQFRVRYPDYAVTETDAARSKP